MPNNILTTLASFSLFVATYTHAYPEPPNIKNIEQYFSSNVLNNFNLFADSHDNTIVYFVSKHGYIRTNNENPNLKIASFIESEYFLGYESIMTQGSFYSLENTKALSQLKYESDMLGYNLTPAPVIKSRIHFIADRFVTDETGEINPSCEFRDIIWPTGETLSIPYCTAVDISGTRRQLQNIYDLKIKRKNTEHTVDELYFSAKFSNNLRPIIEETLTTGASWDHFFSGQIHWELKTGSESNLATITINWVKLYPLLIKSIENLSFTLSEDELLHLTTQLLKNIIRENIISITLEEGVSWWSLFNPNSDLVIALKNELYHLLKDTMFLPLIINNSATNALAVHYTISTNYQKFIELKQTNHNIYSTKNSKPLSAKTDLSIFCIKGEIDGITYIDTSSPPCHTWQSK